MRAGAALAPRWREMTRTALATILAAIATTFGGPAARTERVATASVYVSAERADAAGSFVDGLTARDFHVALDGHDALVESAVPVTAPASVLLLVDLTWSVTRGDHPENASADEIRTKQRGPGIWRLFPGMVRGVDRAFLPLLGPDDRLIVSSFAGRRQSFSRASGPSPEARLRAFQSVIAPGPVSLLDWLGASPIWDATVTAVEELASVPSPRGLVLITDGRATGNRVSLADAVRMTIAHGVAVHVVCEKSWWPARIAPQGDTFVGALADQTGGIFRIDDPFDRLPWDKPARVFRDIVGAMRHSYEVRIDVGAVSEGIRPLEVRIMRPDVVVHTPKWVVVKSERQDGGIVGRAR